MRACMLMAILALAVAPPVRAGDDSTFAAQRARQLRVLASPDAPQPARLSAIDWLGKNVRDRDDNAVAAALEKAIRDSNAAIRAHAVAARGQLATNSRHAFPVAVIEAMLDADATVRENALNWSGVLPNRHSQSAEPVLLRCVQSHHAGVRSLAVLLLAGLPKHNTAMTKAARALTGDKDAQVRTDAHSALYRMTGKLDDIVPYALHYLADRHDDARVQTDRIPPKEQATRNLMSLSLMMRLRSLAEERTDDLAKYLIDSLTKGDARLRRAVALHLAAYYRAQDFELGTTPLMPKLPAFVLPYFEQQAGAFGPLAAIEEREKKRFEASAKKQALFRQRLSELGLAQTLRELRDNDRDGLVRGAAALALIQMEKRHKQGKTP